MKKSPQLQQELSLIVDDSEDDQSEEAMDLQIKQIHVLEQQLEDKNDEINQLEDTTYEEIARKLAQEIQLEED